MDEEKVLKIVKSKFNGMCELLQKAWLIILLFIFLIIPTIIYGTYFLYILSIVVFSIVTSIYMFFRCQQYKAFEYVFYKDKLKFNSNFFNVENKIIKYNNIIEVKYSDLATCLIEANFVEKENITSNTNLNIQKYKIIRKKYIRKNVEK